MSQTEKGAGTETPCKGESVPVPLVLASIRHTVPSGVLVIILFALEQLYQIPGQCASGYFAHAAALLPIRFVLEI